MTTSLLADQMLSVLFIFADAFHQLHVRKEFERHGGFPHLRISLGVINRDFKIQMTKIPAMEPLNGVIGIGVGMPAVTLGTPALPTLTSR